MSNQILLNQIQHPTLLEHLPIDLELLTIEKVKALHIDHIKYLVLSANQEEESVFMWVGSLIGGLSALFTTEEVKKHD